MTTASARAGFELRFSRLRTALLAAASTSLIASLSMSAHAASCATTAGNDSCVITLGDIADVQDGLLGTDDLNFSGVGINLNANQFGTTIGGTVNFANFENAFVPAFTTVSITDGLTTDSVPSMSWTIDGVLTLSGAGGDAIGNASSVNVGGFGLLNVNSDETIGSLSGTGSVVVLGGAELSVFGTGNTWSGDIQGAGNVEKLGIGTWTLDSINALSGTWTVTAGTLNVNHANAISAASNVVVGVAGILSTSNATAYNIGGNVNNAGRIQGNVAFGADVLNQGTLSPGNSPGTMTIAGNYTATATAAFDMEIDLDAALAASVPGTTHDYVDIAGNVTGTTTLRLFETDLADDTGLPTTGNGILLVDVDGTTSATSFRQANTLVAGPYQYLVRHVPNYAGVTDGYFLQSFARDEVEVHATMLSAGQAMVRNCFRDDQRVPDSPKGATFGRAWVGYRQGASNFGAGTGLDAEIDYDCTTGGMDWRLGHGWFGGVSGGMGSVSTEITTDAGLGQLDGDARVVEVYASFTSRQLFLNLSAGYSDFSWLYDGAMMPVLGAESGGLIASAQAGLAFDLDALAVKLMGTLSYDDTNCGETCWGFNVAEEQGLLEAKASLRIDGVSFGGSVRPWIAASYSDVLSDGINRVSSGLVSATGNTNSELISLDAGMLSYLDQNFAMFLEGGYHESQAVDVSGYKAAIGLKMYW